MDDNFNSHINYYFKEGRHKNIQMIVMCHKPAQINNMSRMNCDTIYLTVYIGPHLYSNFNATFKCSHKFHEIISELNHSYFICTDGMAEGLRYVMIKYNVKEDTFFIIDRNKTMICDSRIGFLDLRALSLKNMLESDEIKKLIAYIKPLLNSATDRNTINADNYQFYFNKVLNSRGIKIQNDVVTKETVIANGIKYTGYIATCIGILVSAYSIF